MICVISVHFPDEHYGELLSYWDLQIGLGLNPLLTRVFQGLLKKAGFGIYLW